MGAMFTSLIPQKTQDALVSRHRSWTGKVVCDLSRTDHLRGHYWRVTRSARDPRTGVWEMSWDQRDYMGDQPPKGEPIYKFTGQSWDLKAYPSTVIPWVTICVAPVLATIASYVGWHLWGGHSGYTPDGIYHYRTPAFAVFMMGVFFFLAVQWIVGYWFYRVEHVRGSKVIYAASALTTLGAIRRRHNRVPYERLEPWQ